MRMWTNGLTLASLALAVLLVSSACTAGDAREAETAGSPTAKLDAPATTPADPVEAAERAAIDAYLGMWAAYDAAGSPPSADPADPRLEQYAADGALEGLRSGLTSMKEGGLVIEGDALFYPAVAEIGPAGTPTYAQIEDCADTTNSSRVRADGQPFEDEPGGRRRIVADLERSADGTWRVVDFAVLEVGSCSR